MLSVISIICILYSRFIKLLYQQVDAAKISISVIVFFRSISEILNSVFVIPCIFMLMIYFCWMNIHVCRYFWALGLVFRLRWNPCSSFWDLSYAWNLLRCEPSSCFCTLYFLQMRPSVTKNHVHDNRYTAVEFLVKTQDNWLPYANRLWMSRTVLREEPAQEHIISIEFTLRSWLSPHRITCQCAANKHLLCQAIISRWKFLYSKIWLLHIQSLRRHYR